MQRNFEPMRKQVEAWQRSELTDVTAKVVIYEPFVEGKLDAPKHLARAVHDLYFEVRGIPTANHLEAFQCIHFGVQGTGSHSAQGDGQAGGIPGNLLLTSPSSLRGGTGADRFFLTSDLSRRLTGSRLTPYKPVSG
jgi:hypothetical protein